MSPSPGAVSWMDVLGVAEPSTLEAALARALPEQRWFAGKSLSIERVRVQDGFDCGNHAALVLLSVSYKSDAPDELYTVPLATTAAACGAVNGWTLQPDLPMVDALGCPAVCRRLVEHLRSGTTLPGTTGTLAFLPVAQLEREAGTDLADGELLRGEQTNSSVRFGDQYLLKIFRRLEAGVQPDVEVGAHLTARGFAHVPRFGGQIEFRSNSGEVYSVAILQRWVEHQSDAWSHTIDVLEQLASRSAPGAAGECGTFAPNARLLGERTAQLHRELAADSETAPWRPEPCDQAVLRAWSDGALSLLEQALRDLRTQEQALDPSACELVSRLRASESTIRGRFSALTEEVVTAPRIRLHGDYHLGQLLWTGEDYVVIDFEGEPSRPLAERREKHCVARDVASMVRSFHYAAHFVARRSAAQPLEWFEDWYRSTRQEFLDAYLAAAAGATYLPQSRGEWDRLLNVQLLEKAVYELDYELHHRPDWVAIPVAGILDALQD